MLCNEAAAYRQSACAGLCLARDILNGSMAMQVVKDDVTKHLPPGAKRVAFSRVAPDLVKLKEFVRELPDGTTAVFVVGAMAHGKMDIAYVDQWVSISEYPLSAAYCISRITNAFEDKWDIV